MNIVRSLIVVNQQNNNKDNKNQRTMSNQSTSFNLVNDEWKKAALAGDDYIVACEDVNRSTLNWALTQPELRPYIISVFPSINTYAEAKANHGPYWIHIKILYSMNINKLMAGETTDAELWMEHLFYSFSDM